MADPRTAASEALLVCIERGDPFPDRPEPAALWDAYGGNGHTALLVMLDFIELERVARVVAHERSVRRYRDRRDLAGILAA